MSLVADRDVVTISEAARRVGVHPGSIKNAELAGRIPRLPREPGTDTRIFTETELDTLRRYFDRRSATSARRSA